MASNRGMWNGFFVAGMKRLYEYEKMGYSLNNCGIDPRLLKNLQKGVWVATEKVHGSNFSVTYSNGVFSYFKRKGNLSWDSDFFGFQTVMLRIETKLQSFFDELSSSIPGDEYILYGELCGGSYPHSSVPSVPSLQPVQTGVWYSPQIELVAFDLAVMIGGEKKFLDWEPASVLLAKHDLPQTPVIAKGKLNEVVAANTRINSKVPGLFGLPPLETNLIEGVVIKPWSNTTKTPLSATNRPIFKAKNKEFDEDDGYLDAVKWSAPPCVDENGEPILTTAGRLEEPLRRILGLVNENRLNSAISKVGALTDARLVEIVNEATADVMGDFQAHLEMIEEVSEDDRVWLEGRVRSALTSRARLRLLNIL